MKNEAIRELGYDYPARKKNRVVKCNLCGHGVFVTITHSDRYGFAANATSCQRCTLTVLNPVMDSEEYGHFYAKVYRPLLTAFYGRLYDAKTIQEAQRPYAVEKTEFVKPYFAGKKIQSMLDIGGSTGIVAAQFQKEFGLKATVIDPAPLEIEQAQALGLETITGFVESFDTKGKTYDFIAMFQTIDHLLDVSATLAKVREMLAPGGMFFVDIVDFRAAYTRNRAVERAVKIDHPYYITETTMELYLRKHGFEIVAMDYAADHLHVGYLCRAKAPEANPLPSDAERRAFFAEVRHVQNMPQG